MKRKLAAPQNPPVLTCPISFVTLDETARFELPCCKNPVATDAIVEWFKRAKTNTCPCCRDEIQARTALTDAGHDLNPIHQGAVADPIADKQIYDGVMAHIETGWWQSTRCSRYLEFGSGLIEKRQFGLAAQLMATLTEKMKAAKPKHSAMIATVILDLGDQFKLASAPASTISTVHGTD
ncbi:hypothetical protein EBR57_11125 [bacterium]|nr:hypothetical protein [bacterium]